MESRGAPISTSTDTRDEASPPTQTPRVVPIVVRGSTVKLSIPLDERRPNIAAEDGPAPTYKRHRRDSLERREALLKGREDRLMHNPWVQPPLPSDWHVTATHPVRIVPYFLAPLWEDRLAARREEERERRLKLQKQRAGLGKGPAGAFDAARIPKDLRAQLKRAKAAKGLLHDLEEDIRGFVAGWEADNRRQRTVSFGSAVDVDEAMASDNSEDDIVFIGRNGKTRDDPPSPKASKTREDMVVVEDVLAEKLVFGALVDDKGANFGRWLVHSIAEYYGLPTWSVTRGTPAHRDAYVGIDQAVSKKGILKDGRMPTPLWGMV